MQNNIDKHVMVDILVIRLPILQPSFRALYWHTILGLTYAFTFNKHMYYVHDKG